jgi:S-disulfanyl-L-cysteine oxidoreductase SoxD
MPRFPSTLAFATLTALLTGAWVAQTPPRTVWSGVYSSEQADRGKKVYVKNCQECHGESLLGADQAPGLAGDEFVAKWNKVSVGDLFDRVQSTMPDTNPGSLTGPQYADAVAYVLRENGAPPGKDELPSDLEALMKIMFGPKP